MDFAQRWVSLAYCSFLLASHCGNRVKTSALLEADFLTAGKTNIRLLVPANNASLTTTDALVFVWEEKSGITKYSFELSDSSSFSNLLISKIIDGNNYEFSSLDLKSGFNIESATYYWRVKVPFVANNLQSSAQPVSFIIRNTFYVDKDFTGTTSSGTRTNPYKTIQSAIDAAASSRGGVTSTIAEVRVSKGTYTETIALRPNVAIRGGYDASANWSRNPQANVTTVSRTDAYVISGGSDLTATATGTIIEGFTFQGSYSTNTSWLANFTNVGAVTLRNNEFVINSTSSLDRVFYFIDTPGFVFESNTINGTTSSSGGADLRAFQISNSTGTIRNNIIALRGPTGPNRVPILFDSNSNGTYELNLSNNTIGVFSTTSSSWAMVSWNSNGSSQIVGGQIERNILFVISTVAGSSRCGQQTGGTPANSKVSSFKSNIFADCNSGSGNVGAYFAQANLPASSNFGAPWTAAANVYTNLDSMFRAGNSATNSTTGCFDATSCTNTISGNRGGNTIPGTPTFPGNPGLDIFTGYVSANLKTWTMKPNGAADMDNNGVYDAAIDAGANTATAGLLTN